MQHASGEEFIKALVWREREIHTYTHTQARTAGEFLMSEDLTGDTEAETGGREKMGGGGEEEEDRTDTERRSREETGLLSGSHLLVLACVCALC